MARLKLTDGPSLTLSEMRFLGEWLLDFNSERAYVASGMSAACCTAPSEVKSASKALLKQPHIRKMAETVMRRALTATERTADDILGDLQRIARKAEMEGQYNAAISALDKEGKFHKMFTDVVKVEGAEDRAAAVVAAWERSKSGISD